MSTTRANRRNTWNPLARGARASFLASETQVDRDKDFNPASPSRRYRNSSTLPIPSRAWVKTLEMVEKMTSASPAVASSPTQMDLPQIAAAELPEQRTAASHVDRQTVDSVPRGQSQCDLALGIVASGMLLSMLAWIVTGIEIFAFIGALVAAASAALAIASPACPRSEATETGPRADDPALPRGLPPRGNSVVPSRRHQ